MCFLRGYFKGSGAGIHCHWSRGLVYRLIFHMSCPVLQLGQTECGHAQGSTVPVQDKVLGTQCKDACTAFLRLLNSLHQVYSVGCFGRIVTNMLKKSPWDCELWKIQVKAWGDLGTANDKRKTC